MAKEIIKDKDKKSTSEAEKPDGYSYGENEVGTDYRYKFRLNKATHKMLIPKSEEDETHFIVYIQPTDWPEKDKK